MNRHSDTYVAVPNVQVTVTLQRDTDMTIIYIGEADK